MLVTEELVQELNLQDCLICQEEFEVNQEIAEIPGCCHCFHNECVLKWFTLVSMMYLCETTQMTVCSMLSLLFAAKLVPSLQN